MRVLREEALLPVGVKKPRSLLAAVAETSKAAIVCQNSQGKITFSNSLAEELLGWSAAEMLGKPVGSLVPRSSPASLEAVLDFLQQSDSLDECGAVWRSRGGENIPVRWSACRIRSNSNRTKAVLHFLHRAAPREADRQTGDCPASTQDEGGTELLALQGELFASEARFQSVAEELADMLWVVDARGMHTYLSNPLRRYIGATALHGSDTLLKLVHPDDRSRAVSAWLQASHEGNRLDCEIRLRRFDGSFRWFDVRATPLRETGRAITQWIGLCADIDAGKRNEQALRRSNEELRQFAYAAAHDLQEPLRNVSTCVGMLRRQYAASLDGPALSWIDASIEGARRMHEMVKDLLTFSTVFESTPQREVIDANDAMSETLARLSSSLNEAAPVLEIATLPALCMHGQHAVTLFENLLSNSLKYRRPAVPLQLTVTAAPHGADWHLTFRDNGIGFDPAYADRIFGVFKRLHPRDAYPGNGIGLAICERIVAHYGGRIWAEAVPEAGATFHVILPGCESTDAG